MELLYQPRKRIEAKQEDKILAKIYMVPKK
jgi:hypothetical protein